MMRKLSSMLFGASLIIAGCSSPSAGTAGHSLKVYASKNSIYFHECAWYQVYIDLTGIPGGDLSASVDGTDMTMKPNADGFNWHTCDPFVVGQQLHVALTHQAWGTTEFDLVITDSPESLTYVPDLDTWLAMVQDNDPDNDSLRVSWPPMVYCNDIWGFLAGIRSAGEGKAYQGVRDGSVLVYENRPSNAAWTQLKSAILSEKGFSSLTSFGWKSEIAWGDHATIYARTTAAQMGDSRRAPADVAGVYDLVASYSASSSGFRVDVQADSSVLPLDQTGGLISVNGSAGAHGRIDGTALTLTGDILVGAGPGGSQTFTGSVSGSFISGTLSGTVMAQFPGTTQPGLANIESGSFTLSKRP
jgi:hypothetical protein